MRVNQFCFISLFCCLWSFAAAETHKWNFNATWVPNKNPDGCFERRVVGFNGEWPLPTLRVKKGDRVELTLYNDLKDSNTTLHFHGMFQPGSTQMDGPPMVTQCPIAPGYSFLYNFTVGDQVGTYWYHSHTSGQYGDGMRGIFIIDDDDFPYKGQFDEELTLSLGEWYHEESPELMKPFLNRYNPTGAEPIPQNFLFNETRNVTWEVQPDTTYLVHIVNTGRFTSFYLFMEDHEFEVVEVDGIYVERNTTEMLYITVAQRYTVLIKTKSDTSKNYAFMMNVDQGMLDVIPKDLIVNSTNWIVYNQEEFDKEKPTEFFVDDLDAYLDDFYLEPLEKIALLDEPDKRVVVDVEMNNLGNGVNYAFFNNITYTAPKVPTLMTVLSSGDLASNELIYGTNTHTIALAKDEVIDIVVNNHDTGKHPFHLHGHVFQFIERHAEICETCDPLNFNASDHAPAPEYPARRDTAFVEPNSYMVLRFKADNPGVWFFHCHIEWHLDQGLALVFVEQPEAIQSDPTQQLTDNHKEVCKAVNMPFEGNAAGNATDFTNLKGENVQVKPLPAGFTARGIVALVFSCIAGFLGIAAIAVYGMADIKNIEKDVVEDLNVDIEDEEELESTEGRSSSLLENQK